jgi:hypothetical protein
MPLAGFGGFLKVKICHWMDGEGLPYATGWVGKGYANDRVGKGSNMLLEGGEGL